MEQRIIWATLSPVFFARAFSDLICSLVKKTDMSFMIYIYIYQIIVFVKRKNARRNSV